MYFIMYILKRESSLSLSQELMNSFAFFLMKSYQVPEDILRNVKVTTHVLHFYSLVFVSRIQNMSTL